MKNLLQKLLKYLAYTGAALVIVLAIAVGIFRLMLPRLPEYQEEIKGWASAAIGMQVEFSGMTARWRLSGPELTILDADLMIPDTGQSIITADEVSIGVGLLRLITDRELVVERISISGTAIDLRQDESGNWLLQGLPVDELIGSRDMTAQTGGNVDVTGADIDVIYEHPASGQLVPFTIRSVAISRDKEELGIEAEIDLQKEFGDRIEISANQPVSSGKDNEWRFYIEGDSLELAGWSRLQPLELPEIDSGTADVSLWLNTSAAGLQSATANIVVTDLHAADADTLAPFGFQGSFEYSVELDGWLLAANQFRMTTVAGNWPQSDLQIRIISAPDGETDAFRANASYFNLADLNYVSPWLQEDQQAALTRISPEGIMHNVNAEISGIRSEQPYYSATADLESIGFSASDNFPGVQKFSGRIRADRNGGRVEIESNNLQLDIPHYLAEPIAFDEAFGTIIWRRNAEGMIVLSDNVSIRNADFDSESSLQISVPANGDAPFVDFESSWGIFDIGAMNRYLPNGVVKPALRSWLESALVSGYVREGTTRFNGALDKFPFDNGEGLFRIEAILEDATLKYGAPWPAAEFHHLNLVIENTRLYSTENSAANLGNIVEDALIEIEDLRNPVLRIDAFATGTLESIRQFAMQSPINAVLGGQLDRVEVGGDASFDLSLTFPILDRLNYDFVTRIRSSGGSIRINGFAAPVTELNGVVTVTREQVSSEALFGHFLGQPVDIALSSAGDELPSYSVILDATGSVTAASLSSELGAPLEGFAEGYTDYRAIIRFPNGRAEIPGPLQIQIESDLVGFGLNMPAPMAKATADTLRLSTTIEFPAANRIDNAGSLAGDINWKFQFLKDASGWIFDRGALAVGGEYPQDPEVRGLHIEGQTAELRLHEWIAIAQRNGGEKNMQAGIRSINLGIDNLYAVGQHFTDHQVRVDQSGLDWVIEIRGEQADGVVTVPYDFKAGRPLTLDMRRLFLPGSDEEAQDADESLLSPLTLPTISVRAEEFALGDRHLGKLVVDLESTDRGLEATNLTTVDDTFTITGSAGWVIGPDAASGQRTYFDARLNSTDIEQTMRRLNYQPGINGEDMEVNVQVSWPGGPRQDFMGVVNGNVTARIGAGQLEAVDPGAGRVFGLMSVVALPRRLSLDFRDVFDTGFGFDEISGSFRLEDGEAYTCDLSLAGPAADVGIVGRAGLLARDYDQTAVVSANVGNTLPLVGAVVAGPQVAAALFVFSQIFKKPLQEMGQIYYAIDGSWDDPVIDVAEPERILRTSELAGCSADAR